jgi:hypothetical protein
MNFANIATNRCLVTRLRMSKAVPPLPRIREVWKCMIRRILIYSYFIFSCIHEVPRCKWVPVTTARRVLRLRREERPPIWRVAANVLNQPRTADNGWSYSLGLGEGLTTPRCGNVFLLRNIYRQSLGPGLILCYNLSNERGWTGLSWLRLETGGGHL